MEFARCANRVPLCGIFRRESRVIALDGGTRGGMRLRSFGELDRGIEFDFEWRTKIDGLFSSATRSSSRGSRRRFGEAGQRQKRRYANWSLGPINEFRLRDFVLASWIGMFPGTVLYVSIGSAAKNLSDILAGRSEGSVGQKLLFGVGLLATLAVSVVLARIAKKALGGMTNDEIPNDEGMAKLE